MTNDSAISDDWQFFRRTALFDALPEIAWRRLLPAMTHRHVSAGDRLISQGDEGTECYLIRRGKCVVSLDKGETQHIVQKLGPGDIVGEMAMLTGEVRSANVDAETDMDVRILDRDAFDRTCQEFPQLRLFLTKLVTNRLAGTLFTRDRSIGKYVIEEIVGEGRSSMVYRGFHSSLAMPVAVKMLKHDMAMDPDFVSRFHNEAKVIARLNHENIVKIYDVEELYRTFFIITEYLEAQSLDKALTDRSEPDPAAMTTVMLQICEGLRHAHDTGIVHRDIKPGNILVLKDNRAKIVDFGFACALGTQEKQIRGTALYLSPEQIKGGPVDERTDIYSLGIMAFEMFTGRKPCDARNPAQILEWHLSHDVKDPGEFAPDLPEELRRIITTSTRLNPDDRYRNVGRIMHELEPLAERLGIGMRSSAGGTRNMTGLFLSYRDEHKDTMQRLIREFGSELEKLGADMKKVDF